MPRVDWNVLLQFFLVAGAAVTIAYKMIDKVADFFNKKKDRKIQEAVDVLKKDVDELKPLGPKVNKLEIDLDELIKLLLNRSLKK